MKESLTISYQNEVIGEIKGFIDDNGEPWFIASKVCDCLKLENSSVVITRIIQNHLKYGDRIKGVSIRYPLLQTSGGRQRVAVVNENILYEMIFQSRTKKAFLFQQWIFKEVLPELRKRGEYRMQGKLIRRSLTDTIKTEICEKTDNENEKKFAYSNFTKMIYKKLNLKAPVERGNMPTVVQEKLAHYENLVSALIAEGKSYGEIKSLIFE